MWIFILKWRDDSLNVFASRVIDNCVLHILNCINMEDRLCELMKDVDLSEINIEKQEVDETMVEVGEITNRLNELHKKVKELEQMIDDSFTSFEGTYLHYGITYIIRSSWDQRQNPRFDAWNLQNGSWDSDRNQKFW